MIIHYFLNNLAHDITNVTTYSLHPGIIATNLGRNSYMLMPGFSWLWDKLASYLLMTPQQGASTTIYCAVDEKLKNDSGLYYRYIKQY